MNAEQSLNDRIDELEAAIREALDQFDEWTDPTSTIVLDDIFNRLSASLITDDTMIELVQP